MVFEFLVCCVYCLSLETLNSCIEHEIGWGLYCWIHLRDDEVFIIEVIEDCDFQFRDFPHMLDNKTQSIPTVTPHTLLIFIQMAEVWAIAKVDHIIGFTTPMQTKSGFSSSGTLEIIFLIQSTSRPPPNACNSAIYIKPAGRCTQYYTHTKTNKQTHTHIYTHTHTQSQRSI